MSVLPLAMTSIACSVAAQFALKAGMSAVKASQSPAAGPLRAVLQAALQPGIIFGFALYGLGALIWLFVLAQWDVSKAYPLVGAGFALSILIGYLLGDSISLLRLSGVTLICLGVLLVSRS